MLNLRIMETKVLAILNDISQLLSDIREEQNLQSETSTQPDLDSARILTALMGVIAGQEGALASTR
jgi:hypothetical protein